MVTAKKLVTWTPWAMGMENLDRLPLKAILIIDINFPHSPVSSH